ncbi:hypothetical protein [Niabella aquatica]
MINAIRKIINYLTSKPKTLFLIDGLGAMLTTLLLFVVLRNFNEYFGVSKTILTFLSAISMCFCLYSTACFFFLKANWTPFIRVISYANLLYCVLTVGLVITHNSFISTLGIVYFLAEVIIVCLLVYIELKVATAVKQNRTND